MALVAARDQRAFRVLMERHMARAIGLAERVVPQRPREDPLLLDAAREGMGLVGQGERAIARDLGVSRKTVRRYRGWATTHDLLTGPVPDAGRLQALLAETAPAVTLPSTHSVLSMVWRQ